MGAPPLMPKALDGGHQLQSERDAVLSFIYSVSL
jgi:hypothetical protein